jgi:uncharacterized protein YbgA (DUF1722 family)
MSEREEAERREVERRWRALLASRPTVADLVDFHTRHKMTLLARSPDAYRDLGRLVARASARPLPEVLADYGAGLHGALAQPTTPGRHANVLQHLAGMLPESLASERARLAGLIEQYRLGRAPIEEPVRRLSELLRDHPHQWALARTYLEAQAARPRRPPELPWTPPPPGPSEPSEPREPPRAPER